MTTKVLLESTIQSTGMSVTTVHIDIYWPTQWYVCVCVVNKLPERKCFRAVSLLLKTWLYLMRCATGTVHSVDADVNLCHTVTDTE